MSQIDRVYSLSSVADAQSAYDDWAENYEKDMFDESQDYVAPAIASKYVLKHLGVSKIDGTTQILDAGCGTGLVGTFLARSGAKNLDGIDLSPGMLEVARRSNIYRDLQVADLSQALFQHDQSYDVVVCVGTLTQGHVGPEALGEFARITKPTGFIIATVLESVWQSKGYEAKVNRLVEEGKVQLVSAQLEDYRRGAGVRAFMVVLQIPQRNVSA